MAVLVVRMAYIIYEDSSAVSAAFDKLSADPPSVGGRQLRLLKYDQNVDWPTGTQYTLTHGRLLTLNLADRYTVRTHTQPLTHAEPSLAAAIFLGHVICIFTQ